MASHERELSNQRLFNVAVSRVRDALTLFIDDKAALGERLDRQTGDKTSALEITGQIRIDQDQSGLRASAHWRTALGSRAGIKARIPSEGQNALRVGAGPSEMETRLPEKGLELGL